MRGILSGLKEQNRRSWTVSGCSLRWQILRYSPQNPFPTIIPKQKSGRSNEKESESLYLEGTFPLLLQTSARSGHSGHTWGGSASPQPGRDDRVTGTSGGQSGDKVTSSERLLQPTPSSRDNIPAGWPVFSWKSDQRRKKNGWKTKVQQTLLAKIDERETPQCSDLIISLIL